MSGAPALFSRHRRLALAIARDWHLPGSDRDDVRQEALLALWEAARAYQPGRGATFPTFATTVVRRRLADAVKHANRGKHQTLTNAGRDTLLDRQPAPDIDAVLLHRQRLRQLTGRARTLTPAERDTLRRILDDAAIDGKPDDNQRYKLRRKLKAAAA